MRKRENIENIILSSLTEILKRSSTLERKTQFLKSLKNEFMEKPNKKILG